MVKGLLNRQKGVDQLALPQSTDIEDHRGTTEKQAFSLPVLCYCLSITLSFPRRARALRVACGEEWSHLHDTGRLPWQVRSQQRSSHLQ